MSKKYFSIEEASQLLPLLEGKLTKLVKLKKELGAYVTQLVGQGVRVENLLASSDLDQDQLAIKEKLEKLGLDLQGLLAEIQGYGCVVKDMDLGLLDFYGFMEGEEVFFCWQLGEGEIRYWHKVDEGFAERKPLFESDSSDPGRLYH